MILGLDSTSSLLAPATPLQCLDSANTPFSSYSEAWRYTGPFTRWNRFKGLFPGFGIAATAFAGYLVYEQLFMTSSHHGSEEHGEGHH